MALISIDSLALIFELARNDQTRFQIEETCSDTYRHFPRLLTQRPPPGIEFCSPFWARSFCDHTWGACSVEPTAPAGAGMEIHDPDKIITLIIEDAAGAVEHIIDDFLTQFRNLQSIVIATTNARYVAHTFSKPLSVCVAMFGIDLKTVPIYVEGFMPHLPHWLQTLANLVLDAEPVGIKPAKRFGFKYTANVTEASTMIFAHRPKISTDLIHSLAIDPYKSLGIGPDRYGFRGNIAVGQMLKIFVRNEYTFPQLRTLRIAAECYQNDMSAITAYSPTLFPNVIHAIFDEASEMLHIVSPRWETVAVRANTAISIDCPKCRDLIIDGAKIVTLDSATRPTHITIRTPSPIDRLVLEKLTASASTIDINLPAQPTFPTPPLHFPELKKLVISKFVDYGLQCRSCIRFFAPKLEEVWICGFRVGASTIPRDENGAYNMNLLAIWSNRN